jgi:hypothetical protein
MCLDQISRQIKAETQTRLQALPLFASPEQIENGLELLRRNSNARVANLDHHHRIVASCAARRCDHRGR